MTLREKLLSAIDPEYFRENVSDDILVSILLEQLASTKKALFEAQAALIKEGMRADRAIEQAQHMRGAAFKPPQGDFFFHDPGNPGPFFVVDIVASDVRLSRQQGNIYYALQPITRDTYKELLKKKGN